jgi:hypothetical protein
MLDVIAHARKLRSQARACRAYSRLLVANSADLQRTFEQLRIVALLRSLGISATLNPTAGTADDPETRPTDPTLNED